MYLTKWTEQYSFANSPSRRAG